MVQVIGLDVDNYNVPSPENISEDPAKLVWMFISFQENSMKIVSY